MNNDKDLTLVEALCIKQHGWGTDKIEKQLYFKAEALILKETQRIRLDYKNQLPIERAVNKLKSDLERYKDIKTLFTIGEAHSAVIEFLESYLKEEKEFYNNQQQND
jgi:hypothetical protein